MPRISKETNTQEQTIGQAQEFVMSATGEIDREDFRDQFQTVDTPVQSAHSQELIFMEEKVQVIIPKGANPRAEEQFIQVGSNGVNQFIERGVPQWVKRRFVEVLARAKKDDVQTAQIVNANGEKDTKIIKTPSLLHHFQVLQDPNPNGPVWLQRVLAEA